MINEDKFFLENCICMMIIGKREEILAQKVSDNKNNRYFGD